MIDAVEQNHVSQTTCGNWADERESCAEFDRRLADCGNFTAYPEVWGEYLQPRHGTELKRPRIDRLLVPKPKFIASGWNYGVIGVECKASNLKLGPVVAQCIDYSRAAFTIPILDICVLCSWIFVWPLDAYAGDLASLMDQNRIGGVYGARWNRLNFKTASGNMLTENNDGTCRIGVCRQGRKVGSR